MARPPAIFDLPLVEFVVLSGVASPGGVASVLERRWSERRENRPALAGELQRALGLTDEVMAQASSAVEEWRWETRLLDESRSHGLPRADRLPGIAEASNQENPGPVPPGRLGRYSQFRLIGAGGLGFVYEAIDTTLKRGVALKLVRPDLGAIHTVRVRNHGAVSHGRARSEVPAPGSPHV